MGVPARHRERSGEAGGPPDNRTAVPRDWFRGVSERYVAGADTRGRPEGRPYPGSQLEIHETSGLTQDKVERRTLDR
jgi:hypothetical protein